MARLTDDIDPAETDPSGLGGPPTPSDPPPGGTAPDPFDPAAYRLSGDAMAGLGVKKVLLSVPVRKPDKCWFVRVHPDPAYALQTAVVEIQADRGSEMYLVDRHLWPELAGESTFRPVALFTATNRQGVLFLWPCKLPRADGRADEWGRSALEAVDSAKGVWTRVTANMALGAYDAFQATATLPDPEWPDVPLRELLRTAFKGRRIDSGDHPVLRQLHGEV